MRQSVDIVKQQGKAAKASKAAPTSTAAASASDSLELIHAVMHLYRSQQYQALRDGLHGVTHMDSKVMGFFHRHAGATLSDLAQHSGRDKAQLARLVAGLRERGLLDGEADPADRRSVRLTLSAQGQALQRALHQQARQLAGQAMAGLSADEMAQLQALLGRVHDNLAPSA